jgi:dTMP kinase
MGPLGQPQFVVLEGLDGAGTTTHARLLAEALQARDLRVCLTAEPSQGPVGQVLRAHLHQELTLSPHAAALAFAADRADHLATEILPALGAGAWVVCDRYLLSTLAYQGAGGVDQEWILDVSRDVRAPDLCIYLEVPERVRRGRLGRRTSLDRYEDVDLQDVLAASYGRAIDLLRSRGHSIEVVDASGSREDTHQAIMSPVDAYAPGWTPPPGTA